MTSFEVEVRSKEMIKPSTQTPTSLKTLPFSFSDQIAPALHMPNILFYEKPPLLLSPESLSSLLKTSLSKTLVRFYPLAGRIQCDDEFTDCNDEGVAFYEARVSTTLSSVIQDPNLDELIKLSPFPPFSNVNCKQQQLIVLAAGVQVNYFSCGGVAISLSISHKIGDASTVIAFLNDWSTKARAAAVAVQVADDDDCPGQFLSASFFPPRALDAGITNTVVSNKEKVVTKRIIFDKERIEALKKKAILGGYGTEKATPPSRSMVVCAFIWKRLIEAARGRSHPPKIFAAQMLVGLRTIPNSAVPKNCLGNMYTRAPIASYNMIRGKPQLSETNTMDVVDESYNDNQVLAQLISELEKCVKQIDIKYFERLQNGEDVLGLARKFDDVEICGFSSVVQIPFYEVDFGWGKPVWYSLTSMPRKNRVILCPTKSGQAIEARITLPNHLVHLFEQDDDHSPPLSSRL